LNVIVVTVFGRVLVGSVFCKKGLKMSTNRNFPAYRGVFGHQRLSVRQYRSNEAAIAISEKPRVGLSFKLIRTAN